MQANLMRRKFVRSSLTIKELAPRAINGWIPWRWVAKRAEGFRRIRGMYTAVWLQWNAHKRYFVSGDKGVKLTEEGFRLIATIQRRSAIGNAENRRWCAEVRGAIKTNFMLTVNGVYRVAKVDKRFVQAFSVDASDEMLAPVTKLMAEALATISPVATQEKQSVTQENSNVAHTIPPCETADDARKACPKCGREMKVLVLGLHIKLHAASENRATQPSPPKKAILNKAEQLRIAQARNAEKRRLSEIEHQRHIAAIIKAVESRPPPAEKPKDINRRWIRIISTPM